MNNKLRALLAGAILACSAAPASAAIITYAFSINGGQTAGAPWFGGGTPYGYIGDSVLTGSFDFDDTKTDSTAFVGIDLTVGSRTFTLADIQSSSSVTYAFGGVIDFEAIFQNNNYVYLIDTAQFRDDTGFLACNRCVSGANTDSPVPEPAAWALMLLGFGGLGSALRRRRALGPA